MSEQKVITLQHLKIGQHARVVSISQKCHGLERRRFIDLGILPGTRFINISIL